MSGVLIFVKGPALKQIAEGRKTATIRPWRSCRLQPGAQLSFNGKITVTLLRVEQLPGLDALSPASARAAGFASRADCLRAMRTLYPTLSMAAPCVVLHFASPLTK